MRSIQATALVLVAAFATTGRADVYAIGGLNPYDPGSVTPGIRGIAFDGTPNALVLDSVSWDLLRVSLANASTISSQDVLSAPNQHNSQLAYDSTTGDFYTVISNTTLVRIDGDTLQASQVGTGIGAFFNFVGLAADSSGQLWLATDNSGSFTPQLWSVNKQTGVGTVHTSVQFAGINRQITSLLIDDSDQFIVAARNGNFGGHVEFDRLDPNTGNTTVLTLGNIPYINAMAYDPVTDGYYGIEDHRVLVQIVGIPEPGSLSLAGIGLFCLAFFARRRKRGGIRRL